MPDVNPIAIAAATALVFILSSTYYAVLSQQLALAKPSPWYARMLVTTSSAAHRASAAGVRQHGEQPARSAAASCRPRYLVPVSRAGRICVQLAASARSLPSMG